MDLENNQLVWKRRGKNIQNYCPLIQIQNDYEGTCIEDHEIAGWISCQNASVHVDVVSYSSCTVSQASEGHTPDC